MAKSFMRSTPAYKITITFYNVWIDQLVFTYTEGKRHVMGVFPANNIQQKIQSIKSLSNVLKMLKKRKIKMNLNYSWNICAKSFETCKILWKRAFPYGTIKVNLNLVTFLMLQLTFPALLSTRSARGQRHPGPRGSPSRPDDDQRTLYGTAQNSRCAREERFGEKTGKFLSCQLCIEV